MLFLSFSALTSMVVFREEDIADGDEPHGHVTSISVLRSYRRLGLAKRLMVQSREYKQCQRISA